MGALQQILPPNPHLKDNLAMQRTQKLLGKLALPGLN